MGFAFNPFTGNFDLKGSGGGDSYIDGEVATYADLPLDGTAAINSAWLVRTASGVWPVTRKQAGIYIRTATGGSNRDSDFTYAGTMPDVFSDSQFVVYDDADATKNLKFQLSNISTGQTRTLTVPNSSGEISIVGHTHIASDIVFGQFANNRINWGSPDPIGGSTAAAGTFTTLTANTSLVLKDGTGNETATFDVQNKLSANRTYDLPDASGTIALTSLVGASAELVIACSDETTNLTTGTAKVTFRMPYAMTLSSVRASVNTAPTGSTLVVDINEGGSTILSTKLSIDASELTSTTAATAAVISDTALADDAEITIDIDQIGSTIAGKGLKVVLKGTRA
jgi:hypothetical protein